jgi:hypothetical protein
MKTVLNLKKVWNSFDANPLAVHKAIRYQFKNHLDSREFEIPEKLQEWATSYSHVYVAYYDPESLQVDTIVLLKEWKVLADMDTSMEDASISTEECWIAVPPRTRPT